MDLVLCLLSAAIPIHVVSVRLQLRQIRRDILSVSKNARQARTALSERKEYKKLL